MASQHCVACVYLHHGELFLYFSVIFHLFVCSPFVALAFFSMLNAMRRKSTMQKAQQTAACAMGGEREREIERKERQKLRLTCEKLYKDFCISTIAFNQCFYFDACEWKSFPGEFFLIREKKVFFCETIN